MLHKKFDESNIVVTQAVEDADSLIINTAINMSPSHDSVFVVEEDIDFLVLLTALARHHKNVYFRKHGKPRKNSGKNILSSKLTIWGYSSGQ